MVSGFCNSWSAQQQAWRKRLVVGTDKQRKRRALCLCVSMSHAGQAAVLSDGNADWLYKRTS